MTAEARWNASVSVSSSASRSQELHFSTPARTLRCTSTAMKAFELPLLIFKISACRNFAITNTSSNETNRRLKRDITALTASREGTSCSLQRRSIIRSAASLSKMPKNISSPSLASKETRRGEAARKALESWAHSNTSVAIKLADDLPKSTINSSWTGRALSNERCF